MASHPSFFRVHGFSLSSGVLLLVGVFVVFAAVRFGDDNRWVEHTHRVIRAVDQLKDAQDRSGIHARNYLLTGSQDDLVEFRVANAALGRSLGALYGMVGDNPDQLRRVALLRPALAERSRILAALMAHPKAEHASGVAALARQRARTDALYAALIAAEDRLLVERAARSANTLRTLIGAALLAIPLSLLLLRHGQAVLTRENRARAETEQQLQRSVASLERLSVELEALSTFAGLLQGASSLDELFVISAKTFPRLLPGVSGQVFLIKASRDYAEVAAEWGRPLVASDPLPAPDTCWAVRRQRPHLVDDAAEGLLCAHCHAEPDSHAATVCLPLGGQGEAYGWITLTAAAPIDAESVRLASNACEQLSLALGNARLRDALRHQSVRDALTGLYNRRYLEEGLVRELARCMRRQLPLAVLMLDLDHFKAFNDTYGHAGGDLVLATFGKLLEASCRTEDIPCRFGGEEFALVLPEASAQVALLRAQQIRDALAIQALSHMGRELGHVTVSIGVAAWPVNGRTPADLLQAADAALYRAKHAGRDRAEMA